MSLCCSLLLTLLYPQYHPPPGFTAGDDHAKGMLDGSDNAANMSRRIDILRDTHEPLCPPVCLPS